MHIAAYDRVSTDDQNEQRQMRAIREKEIDIDTAIANGKRIGRPPFGYTVEKRLHPPNV